MNILFHDCDGCLNTATGDSIPLASEPYPADLQTLLASLGTALDASDIDQLIINTGRSLADTQPLVPLINSPKLRFLVVEHGAVIFDVLQNEFVTRPESLASRLVPIQRFIHWYQESGKPLLEQWLDQPIAGIDKEFNLTLLAPPALDDNELLEAVRKLIEKSPCAADQLIIHHSRNDRLVDVMSDIDKGEGVSVFCQHYVAHSPTTFAVGNGLNDLPMMKFVDTAICPANSEPEMIDYCRRNNGVVSDYSYAQATLHWLHQRIDD